MWFEYSFAGFLVGCIFVYTILLIIEKYVISKNFIIEYDDVNNTYHLKDNNRSLWDGRTIYTSENVDDVYEYYEMIKVKNVGFPKKLKK